MSRTHNSQQLALWDFVGWVWTLESRIGGQTALHIAAIRDHVEVIEVLLSAGVDINSLNNDGNTPGCARLQNVSNGDTAT